MCSAHQPKPKQEFLAAYNLTSAKVFKHLQNSNKKKCLFWQLRIKNILNHLIAQKVKEIMTNTTIA